MNVEKIGAQNLVSNCRYFKMILIFNYFLYVVEISGAFFETTQNFKDPKKLNHCPLKRFVYSFFFLDSKAVHQLISG